MNDEQNQNLIFDDVFKTILEYLTFLIIPLINEVFHTRYAEDCNIEYHSEEYNRADGRRIIDSNFRIGNKLYHIECQSTPDSRMVIRMIEYDFVIALRSIEKTDGAHYVMEFPRSCVLYLRHTGNTPDTLNIQVRSAGGETMMYECPVIKVQDYTKDEIFEKNLLMLLPFYLMRYEDEMKQIGRLEDIEEADGRMDSILEEYKNICDRLYDKCDHGKKAYLYKTLIEQIKKIAEYLSPLNEKERVIDMGGTAIKPEAQIILEQGINQGIIYSIKNLMETMSLSAEQAMDALKVPMDDRSEYYEKL